MERAAAQGQDPRHVIPVLGYVFGHLALPEAPSCQRGPASQVGDAKRLQHPIGEAVRGIPAGQASLGAWPELDRASPVATLHGIGTGVCAVPCRAASWGCLIMDNKGPTTWEKRSRRKPRGVARHRGFFCSFNCPPLLRWRRGVGRWASAMMQVHDLARGEQSQQRQIKPPIDLTCAAGAGQPSHMSANKLPGTATDGLLKQARLGSACIRPNGRDMPAGAAQAVNRIRHGTQWETRGVAYSSGPPGTSAREGELVGAPSMDQTKNDSPGAG